MQTRIIVDETRDGAQNQRLVEATLDGGQATDRHYHRETEEIYFLLSGTGEMELDGDRRDVEPGDSILIMPGARHQLRATGDGVRFLCMSAPPYRKADTFYD